MARYYQRTFYFCFPKSPKTIDTIDFFHLRNYCLPFFYRSDRAPHTPAVGKVFLRPQCSDENKDYVEAARI